MRGKLRQLKPLWAALSATVGTGNIAGVATAVALGGPGALFWMWLTALVGMATKYASCVIAIAYREKHANGNMAGGPMYVLKNALNLPKLGAAFALFTIIASFGSGNTVQANAIVSGIGYVVP